MRSGPPIAPGVDMKSFLSGLSAHPSWSTCIPCTVSAFSASTGSRADDKATRSRRVNAPTPMIAPPAGQPSMQRDRSDRKPVKAQGGIPPRPPGNAPPPLLRFRFLSPGMAGPGGPTSSSAGDLAENRQSTGPPLRASGVVEHPGDRRITRRRDDEPDRELSRFHDVILSGRRIPSRPMPGVIP